MTGVQTCALPIWGSLVFLGELVTDAALDTTGTGQSRIDCEGCQRCVAACPTGALHDGLLDTAKCRSAITQKKDSLTPWEEEQIALGGLAWGCDICTLACPHNAHIPITPIGEFTRGVSPVLTEQNLDALLMNRAFSWRGKEVLARNLRILAKPTERTTTMTFEVLTPEQYREADDFIQNHPYGSFTQCTRWAQVKSEWGHRTIVSRLPSGIITGALLVLMRPIPFLKTVMLYAPRGPVCYPDDAMTIAALKEGVDSLAKQHRAYAFSCDPDVLMQNTAFIDTMKKLGFRHSYGPTGFEGIQARYNYRTYLNGCTEEEMFARLGQSTRRKVRIAMRKGVEIFVSGPEHLDDFVRIMRITGERDGFAVRPKAYFERFLAAMGEHARLYMGLCEGQVVCGAIAVNFAKKCCYVYGASDSIFRDAMPNYLMQWEMMRWAIQTGCDTYDFQGVSGNLSEENNPLFGLYRFKRGFPGQIDELVGEFDAVYRPVLFAAVEKAAAAAKGLRRLRHRRREG